MNKTSDSVGAGVFVHMLLIIPFMFLLRVLQWFSTTIRLVIKRLKKCKGKGRKNSAISCRLNYKLCYYNDLLGSENYEDAIKYLHFLSIQDKNFNFEVCPSIISEFTGLSAKGR